MGLLACERFYLLHILYLCTTFTYIANNNNNLLDENTSNCLSISNIQAYSSFKTCTLVHRMEQVTCTEINSLTLRLSVPSNIKLSESLSIFIRFNVLLVKELGNTNE